MSWMEERHACLTIATDASAFKYGFVINPGCDFEQSGGDFGAADDHRPIHLKVVEGMSKPFFQQGNLSITAVLMYYVITKQKFLLG